jgi:hypothetical protein
MVQQHDHVSRSTAKRFAALVQVGTALLSELDETRLLTLIAETACGLTGSAFAAFSVRPVNEEGQPLVPSEGSLFYLAAVVGVTPEQEALFRRMPLGGEGLLAPIFQQGVPVLVADALAHLASSAQQTRDARTAAREAAVAYAQGHLSAEALPSLGCRMDTLWFVASWEHLCLIVRGRCAADCCWGTQSPTNLARKTRRSWSVWQGKRQSLWRMLACIGWRRDELSN